MIQELVEYSKWLKRDFPDLFEGQLEEGLHFCIKFHGDQISDVKSYKVGKKTPSIDKINKFVFYYANEVFKSNVITANKCIHNDKYILSNNPFCYKLNIVTETEFNGDISKIGQIRRQKIENHLNILKRDFVPNYDKETIELADKVMQIFLNLSIEVIKSIKIDETSRVFFSSTDSFVLEILVISL